MVPDGKDNPADPATDDGPNNKDNGEDGVVVDGNDDDAVANGDGHVAPDPADDNDAEDDDTAADDSYSFTPVRPSAEPYDLPHSPEVPLAPTHSC